MSIFRRRAPSSLRSGRLLAPLVTLAAFALLAIVLAAQAGLAFCTNRVAISTPSMADMPGMPTGPMPTMHHALLVCPVVLVLIIASGVLAAAAIFALWTDPHRGLTQRTLARALSEVRVLPTASFVGISSGFAVAAMIMVNGAGVPSVPTCAFLLGLLVAGALLAVVVSVVFARVVLALGARLLVAIISAIGRRTASAGPVDQRFSPRRIPTAALDLLAARCGLRAPPILVR
jgi:hypothetical protein